MLTEEELKFVHYWEQNREKKKTIFGNWRFGVTLSLVMVGFIFLNVATGWHKRAAMVVNSNPSFIIVLIVAAILIIAFITIFSAHHKWERNEQRYKELLSKK